MLAKAQWRSVRWSLLMGTSQPVWILSTDNPLERGPPPSPPLCFTHRAAKCSFADVTSLTF
jgi:hypothetical protein